jgi:hypothetical protein
VPRPAVSALTATLFSASLTAGLVLALAPGLHGPAQAGAHDGAAALLVWLLAAGALGL